MGAQHPRGNPERVSILRDDCQRRPSARSGIDSGDQGGEGFLPLVRERAPCNLGEVDDHNIKAPLHHALVLQEGAERLRLYGRRKTQQRERGPHRIPRRGEVRAHAWLKLMDQRVLAHPAQYLVCICRVERLPGATGGEDGCRLE
jgi:hypothetical protein